MKGAIKEHCEGPLRAAGGNLAGAGALPFSKFSRRSEARGINRNAGDFSH